MRILYLDTFSGISGDMTIGALLDAGVPLSALEHGLAPLGLAGYRLERGQRVRAGITATKLHVHVDETGDSHAHVHVNPQKHEPEPPHEIGDARAHAQAHETGQAHRHYREIRERIERAALPPRVCARAQRIFRALADAEGRVHGMAPDDVAFHEVGAIDAIVDVVGTAICLEHLGIEEIFCGPLPLGSGLTRSAHGIIPVPPPAVVELLRGFPARLEDGTVELVTPTGAAIVAALATPGRPPEMIVRAVGYGAGDRELADRPNLLRAIVGDVASAARAASGAADGALREGSLQATHPVRFDEMVVLEANIDDMSPELYEPAVEALFAAGARDVTLSPLSMKKGRPGTLIQVIAEPELRDALAAILLRETSTIGVRCHPVSRLTLPRTQQTIDTDYGPVLAKVVMLPDGTERATPEYDDCRRVAKARGVSVSLVYMAARRASGARG